jgi:uncharacterized linocin/CFP29 family protein
MRDAAPLTSEEWSRLDGLVTDVAKRIKRAKAICAIAK